MPRCVPALPPPGVIDAVFRTLPLRIPTEVLWLRVLTTPPEDAGSLLLDCMKCALEEAPPLSVAPPAPPPPLPDISRGSLHRVEWWHEGALRLPWLGQCRDCLTVYWCDTRGEDTWPPPG